MSELLRGHRRALGFTQEELAERAGISPRSISELERGGAHVPRRDTLVLLTRALGIEGAEREALDAIASERRRAIRPTPETQHTGGHNVPRSLTPFIGRDQDLEQLGQLLATSPLLTLVGPGGVGKTRLAEELVRAHAARFVDGCWLVELAGLSDPALVPTAIAQTIGLREVRAEHVLEALAEYVGEKYLLLVLDNCEHVIEACAELVSHLLSRCVNLQLLATSREPLAIPGEVRWQVLPLELPATSAETSIAELEANAAVRLFLDRAAAVEDIGLTSQNAVLIARICVSVDGIPLALELAAASTRILSLNELADRLDADGDLLSASNRLTPARHRTLRATIDWSHDLLSDPERVLLRRLSVFAGGWSLEAVEQVCSGASVDRLAVLERLADLVDKSLVVVDAGGSAARYRLLEPVRQYASERLEAAAETQPYQERHAMYFLALARSGPLYPAGPEELSSIERFEQDHANLRSALHWALSHERVESALAAASALFQFWERRGLFQEGIAWLEQALARADAVLVPVAVRSGALNALAFLYWRGGAAERAQPYALQALAISAAVEHGAGMAHAWLNLGMSAYLQHHYQQAEEHLEECIRCARESGRLPMLSVALAFLGRVRLAIDSSNHASAAEAVSESLSLACVADSQYGLGHALTTRGDLSWNERDTRGALRAWQRALHVFAELSDARGTAGCLERVALALAAETPDEQAAWVFGAADAQHARLRMQLRPGDTFDLAHFAQYADQELVRKAFPAAWSSGRTASPNEAVARAIEYAQRVESA